MQTYVKYSINIVCFSKLKMSIINIKRCYNIAAMLFRNISPTCHSTLWQRSRNFPGLRFYNFHSMLWKRCYNLKLLAGMDKVKLPQVSVSMRRKKMP